MTQVISLVQPRLQTRQRNFDDPKLFSEIQRLVRDIERQFLTTAAIFDIESWHEVGATDEPAFANSWVDYAGTPDHETAGFYRDPLFIVRLKGSIKNGTVGSVPCFTLPVGYRPLKIIDFSTIDGAGTPSGTIEIQADGDVWVTAGNNAHIALDSVSFRVEPE